MAAPAELRGESSIRVNGAMEPEDVEYVIKVSHRVQISGTVATTATTSVTPVSIENVIPGNDWVKIRLVKIDVWGPTTGSTTVTLNGGSGAATTESARFVDYGTPGGCRSQVHIMPAVVLRQAWWASTSTTQLFQVTFTNHAASGVMSTWVINMTVEVCTDQLPAPAAFAYSDDDVEIITNKVRALRSDCACDHHRAS